VYLTVSLPCRSMIRKSTQLKLLSPYSGYQSVEDMSMLSETRIININTLFSLSNIHGKFTAGAFFPGRLNSSARYVLSYERRTRVLKLGHVGDSLTA